MIRVTVIFWLWVISSDSFQSGSELYLLKRREITDKWDLSLNLDFPYAIGVPLPESFTTDYGQKAIWIWRGKEKRSVER